MAGSPGTTGGGRMSARQLQPCGTMAAYTRHRRHGETPCAACMEANPWPT